MGRIWSTSFLMFVIVGFVLFGMNASTAAAATVDCSGVEQSVDYEIHDIQGSGNTSPYAGKTVTTCGTVIATHSNGYWIQDTSEDGNAATSEGIYVYHSNGPGNIEPGDVVTQTGTVKEYYELTEIAASSGAKVVGSSSVPAPIELTSTMTKQDFESFEGMRVMVKNATAVAGSNEYKETYLVPGTTTNRVDRKDATTPLFKMGDKLGNYISGASTFDTITGSPIGPMDYDYGAYTLQWNSGTLNVSDEGHTENSLAADSSSTLTVETFNVENYFAAGSEVTPGDSSTTVTQEAFDTKTAKLSLAIRNNLGYPDVLAVQEVENKQVLASLAAKIEADGGPNYTPYLKEGNDSRGIDVGYLVKDGVNVVGVEQIGENATTTVNGGCADSGNLLFDRPPLLLHVKTDSGVTISVINNHFMSKSGPDACRSAQATYVADAAEKEQSNEMEVMVTGDLNSYGDEEPVAILENNANLTNMIYHIPEENRFSYIYTGKAQFLDHLLVSGGLQNQVTKVNSAKINPDFPASLASDPTTPLSVSDHDPLGVVFNYGTSYDGGSSGNDGKLVISEVYYDTTGTDSKEEFVELYNGTSADMDLSGYSLQDNYESFTLPSGTFIAPGQYLVIAKDAAGFSNLFGFSPAVGGMSISLSNSGDQVVLKDEAGNEMDFVAYEGYASGWDIRANRGEAIIRTDVASDSDSVSDWAAVAPSPNE
ncbi:lamin tail domain-containing protein [Thalassobacillus devorans]|uniref:lamin tail domain-containing protein n=1 Tax=Thalassobacillus devorans TaxID=279813 RepID=UPI000491BDA2|nr:lamin tail domain-containing protein [Thalassobacillus devorans]